MLWAHAWDKQSKTADNISSLPDTCIRTIFQECEPDRETIDAYKVEVVQGFGYHTLLGKNDVCLYYLLTWHWLCNYYYG